MRFFDLHCDTLYRSLKEDKDLLNGDMGISIKRSTVCRTYIGCFAVWIPDEYRESRAINLFKSAVKRLDSYIKVKDSNIKVCSKPYDIENVSNIPHGNRGIILTVEGGAIFAGQIQTAKWLYDCGVRVITLTWNGSCEIGDGIGVESAKGITTFGKKAVKEMERLGIIVDVSHASERLFYDICSIAQKPFIATHSNSRTVCKHPRNLTDEQFKAIKSVGGIVGINFSRGFLEDNGNASFSDILKHTEHFVSMSGENILAIGSDFDGTDMPDGISGIESIPELYEFFLKHNYSEDLTNKLFYGNAYRFFINNLK